jgi:tetratricopeptide (TPR) repeat protein
MERTAENHLRLCAFCIENSLFAQARHEWDRAKELNPELSEEVARTPEVRQGIAKRMLENARKLFAAKELEEAEKAASSLVTHFPETPAAEQAQALLEEVNGSIQARETKTREEAEAKWKKSEEKDFESKKKSVAPIYQSWETAKKMRAQGLRTKGHSASKNALVAAGQQFEKALARVASVRKSQAKDAEVIAHLDEIEPEIREDAVGAYVDAGSVLVARGSYKTASELARRALAIDPNSSHARSFQQRVEVAAAMASRSWR